MGAHETRRAVARAFFCVFGRFLKKKTMLDLRILCLMLGPNNINVFLTVFEDLCSVDKQKHCGLFPR